MSSVTTTTSSGVLLMQNQARKLIPSVKKFKRTLVETSNLLKSLKNHQHALNTCIRGSNDLYFLFTCLMKSVSTECSQYSNVLSNIKCELEIARKNNRFDVISVFEILESSKKLLNYSKIIEQQNRLIQKSIANYIEIISHEKSMVENNFSSTITSMIGLKSLSTKGVKFATLAAAATATAVNIYSHSSTPSEKGKSAVIGTMFAAFSLSLIDVINNNNMDPTLEILNELQKKLKIIQSSSDQFALLTNKVVNSFINYTNSADKNVTYLFQTGARATALATKMIEETTLLQSYFNIIESKANQNASYFVTLENHVTASNNHDFQKTKRKNK